MAITIISKETSFGGRFVARITRGDGEGFFLEFDSVKTNPEIIAAAQNMLANMAGYVVEQRRTVRIEARLQQKIEQLELRRIAEQEVDAELVV